MNTEAQVRSAKSPQEAMIVIAKALDRIEFLSSRDTQWVAWDNEPTIRDGDSVALRSAWLGHVGGEEVVAEHERRTQITATEDDTDVVIPAPSDEKKERRRQFERQNLKLSEFLGDSEDWSEAYAKGGPMWLYLGNRELVMSMPDGVRTALVQDVIEDSPQDAHEMGRDILKQPCEDGPGSVAMRANDQIVNVP
jgi:hypothetical protein